MPSCSVYAQEAIRRHGAGAGLRLALRRLLRCHPFHPRRLRPRPLGRASMEERRLLLAVALSLLVLTAYQYPFRPAAARRAGAAASAGAAPRRPADGRSGAPGAGAAAAGAPGAPQPAPRPAGAAGGGRERAPGRGAGRRPDASPSPTGAPACVSWQLQHFATRADAPGGDGPDRRRAGRGPWTSRRTTPTLDARLREALFQPSTEQLDRRAAGASCGFRFESRRRPARPRRR